MSHINGMPDRDLHNQDGTHRTTPVSTAGHMIENHQHRLLAHLELHKAEDDIAEALKVANS